MRRWLAVVAITDDGISNLEIEAEVEPTYLLTDTKSVKKQLYELNKQLPSGIEITPLWLEESIP